MRVLFYADGYCLMLPRRRRKNIHARLTPTDAPGIFLYLLSNRLITRGVYGYVCACA